MNVATPSPFLARIGACAALFFALRLCADVVETSNGARLVGKITSIHGGIVTLDTDYAGEIKVKQEQVASIATDNPVAVRLADGTRVIGIVTAPAANKLVVTSPTRAIAISMANISATWAAGQEDPDVVALRRKWSYEAGIDVNGRSGGHKQLTTGYGFRAKLEGPDDEFQYFTSYQRQETDGQVSADQFKAGADYADNFTKLASWYVRDEGGFDRVNEITFFDVAAGGLGYDLIREKYQPLTARVGLSYRYDKYSAANSPALSSLGLDTGLDYDLKIGKADLTDKLTFVPAFKDFGNYVVVHELTFQVPITKSLWKLGMGVTNNYDSRPVSGLDKLDTLYFTRLVFTWGRAQ